jgi:hypothetical protein
LIGVVKILLRILGAVNGADGVKMEEPGRRFLIGKERGS